MKEIKDLGFGIIQVNEPKPTISKTESVDNYLCKWQKLKEYIGSQIIHYDRLTGIFRNEKNDGCVLLSTTKRRVLEEILYKMQELEGEDVED